MSQASVLHVALLLLCVACGKDLKVSLGVLSAERS